MYQPPSLKGRVSHILVFIVQTASLSAQQIVKLGVSNLVILYDTFEIATERFYDECVTDTETILRWYGKTQQRFSHASAFLTHVINR